MGENKKKTLACVFFSFYFVEPLIHLLSSQHPIHTHITLYGFAQIICVFVSVASFCCPFLSLSLILFRSVSRRWRWFATQFKCIMCLFFTQKKKKKKYIHHNAASTLVDRCVNSCMCVRVSLCLWLTYVCF